MMSKLMVCYEGDLPSLNMKKVLLKKLEWEDLGSDGNNSYLKNGDTVLMTIDKMHVYADGIDRKARDFGIRFDEMIVLSKHSSASGKPTLTVHPIGNYKGNDLGGKERALVAPTPHTMTESLRRISALNDTSVFEVSFEVTHHGPYVDIPTMYIEIGSDENHWGDEHAAEILVDSLLTEENKNYPVVVGIGGGHYAPRFTELALSHKVDIGHMLPMYQIKDAPDEEIERMIRSSAESTGTRCVYVHRNSMKGAEERRINGIIDALGYERLVSKDFEEL